LRYRKFVEDSMTDETLGHVGYSPDFKAEKRSIGDVTIKTVSNMLPTALLHDCPSCAVARGVWCAGHERDSLSVFLHDSRVALTAAGRTH
jgi:hypothetical protein